MCGGGGGGDGGAGKREAQRQAKISQGYEEIKRIFDGYTKGINSVTAPVVGQQYYLADGTPITADNTNMGQEFFSGVESSPGFDNNFYNSRETAYKNFALPQMEDQYTKAQQQLMYALARTGRLQSSTRGTKFADLQKEYDINKTNIADKARQYAGDARSNVERARSDLVALNNSVADPNAIAAQAAMSSQSLSTMPAFDPMAPLFQNVTEGIATQADLERRNAARYNTGLFTPSLNKGSGRNVGY